MLAKFNTGDGTAVHECVAIIIHNDTLEPEELNGKFAYGLKDGAPIKRVVITKPNGEIAEVAFGLDAALCNNNGIPIYSL